MQGQGDLRAPAAVLACQSEALLPWHSASSRPLIACSATGCAGSRGGRRGALYAGPPSGDGWTPCPVLRPSQHLLRQIAPQRDRPRHCGDRRHHRLVMQGQGDLCAPSPRHAGAG
ncbi:hypothetical protein Ctob_008274 [Chrysochromulina tobinii]|uniref:Uncharacterized protein n=1 Tax=Chrysochromulina tobinii TaxID=1460289 RepID=A0A0M0K0X0_9EUKA|nr:hypothetical protein Ctob_008274 [Chrysochromulina tobinii]|eukprot:KOO32257.1 hypothetical protein Ctob_008274 [Chrysochromulina sp. CCMP291]